MRTHLVIGLGVALYFLPHVSNRLIFIPVVLITSLLPDIDSGTSAFGKKILFKPVQWIFSHRGPVHSYTLCIFLSGLLAFFYPVVALPFFLGYSFHLVADSFTSQGIRPFWPLKFQTSGIMRCGGKTEQGIFYGFLALDALLIALLLL